MSQTKKLTILSFLLFISIGQFAISNDQIILRQLSIDQRLPGVSLQCIFQDSKGIMWFGIESVGLCKFDGQDYIVFQNISDDEESISNNFPIDIIEDKNGTLWIATLNGLNKYNRKKGTFKSYYHDDNNVNSLSDNSITQLMEDSFGNIWITTTRGVSVFNTQREEFAHVLSLNEEDLNKIQVSSVYEDDDGDIWIGTFQYGLFKVSAKTNIRFATEWKEKSIIELEQKIYCSRNWKLDRNVTSSLQSNDVRSIIKKDLSELWVGSSEGLYVFNTITETFKKIKFNGPNKEILNSSIYGSLYLDVNGALWCGLTDNGLVIYKNQGDFTYFSANSCQNNGLKSNSIRDIFRDSSGLIWIATKFQGIQIYDRRQELFKHITENDNLKGLSHKFVLALYEDKSGSIWVGTKGGGLNKYDPKTKKFTYFMNGPGKNNIGHNRVEDIISDKDDGLWIATGAGIVHYSIKTKTFKQVDGVHTKKLYLDNEDNLWIGSLSTGVYLYDKTSNSFVRNESEHTDFFQNSFYNILSIMQDKSGFLWIGTRQNGLFVYNKKNDSLRHYVHNPKDTNSISGNMIRSIYEDRNGNLWIGTKSDGLNILSSDRNSFNRITKEDGLPSNTIYHIMEDNFENLWMGTHNGITKYNYKKNSFTSFNETYGLQSKVYECNAHFLTTNGEMLMGGANGFNIFNPDSTYKKKFIAPVIISAFQVFDEVIANDITEFQEFDLSYGDNYLSFDFSILDYSDPVNNQYAYFLEGFDKDWTYCGNRHFVSYTSLPPGVYYFNVKGANMDGDWNNEGIRIKFTIPLPYWQKWWFISILVLLLTGLILSFYFYRINIVRKNEKYLKKVVEQKTSDLTDAYKILEGQKEKIEAHNAELTSQQDKIKQQNEELEKHRTHLELLVQERTKDLETAKQKAEDSDKIKSAFLANMSHEIRTPLNAIVGFTDLIVAEDFDPDELNDMYKIIKTNSDSLLQLVNDIIDISKIEANQLEIHNDYFTLNDFMQKLFIDYRRHLDIVKQNDEVDFLLELDTPDNEIKIYSDKYRIKQIFTNLFSNAAKFTRKGHIKMGYKIVNGKKAIRFFMEDTGIGISAENLKIVFDRFRKIEDDKTKLYRGTGLGLSISANLAELLDGKMWADSKINKGTTFYFELNIEINEEMKDDLPKNKTFLGDTPNWEDKHILIVEDEDSNFKVLNSMLRKTKIQITRAEDGQIAIDLCSTSLQYDLILMDIKLPKVNGIEATERIKKTHPTIPIIAQTAYAMHGEERDIMKAGFEGYITKPIASDILIKKISELF